jgi:hypothetical protein
MPIATKKQIRESVLDTTQQEQSQIGDLVDDFINITMQEIGDPSWAFRDERLHLWSWLKRKTSFTASAEDVILERDVDKIALMRQLDSPLKLSYVPDEIFYRELPEPTETGHPRIYRLWEVNGVSTKLSAADTVNVVSSSSLDTADYTVAITGYISGRLETETYTMNGISAVSGTKTFDARELLVSKSAITNGNITVTKNTGATSLVVIGREEISPRFKVASFWPIPSSTVIYMEYYKRIKELNNDSESPEFDSKWHHVVRLGTLAKVYEHLGKTVDAERMNGWYSKMVRSMVASDSMNPDSFNYLRKRDTKQHAGVRIHLSEDTIV